VVRDPGMERRQVKDIRGKRLVQAVAFEQVLKAAACLYICDYLREVLRMHLSRKYTLLSPLIEWKIKLLATLSIEKF
jgi:hypothetical protein